MEDMHFPEDQNDIDHNDVGSLQRKRPRSPDSREKMYQIPKRGMAGFGGAWAGVPPFSGTEEQFYRWVSEPALWARLVLNGLEGRTQHRLSQHHAAMHDALDASGFVLWRTFPRRRACTLYLKQLGMPLNELPLQRVGFRQNKLQPSLRFGEGWETHTSAVAEGGRTPEWVYGVRQLISTSIFRFMGAEMPVVDDSWAR